MILHFKIFSRSIEKEQFSKIPIFQTYTDPFIFTSLNVMKVQIEVRTNISILKMPVGPKDPPLPAKDWRTAGPLPELEESTR